MTYTSFMVKLLTSIILAVSISLLILPQEVSSDDKMILIETPVVIVAPTPPPVVKKPVVQTLIKGDCTKYTDIISKYDWPVATAMEICKDESSGNPTNINWNDPHYDAKGNLICKTSAGLMQISCEWGYTLDELINPVQNIKVAYQIYSSSGFNPWTTYTKIVKYENLENNTIVP